MAERRRIAILGGGMAGLTTAFELSSAPDWADRFEITVYQLGWRLGGKGASSRNPAQHGRIEEHGLHVWFGCYDEAFRVLRAAYAELGRPPSAPFATIEEAFHPQDETPYFERVDGRWTVWPLWFPPSPDEPGTGGPNPTIRDDLVKAIEAIVHAAEGLLGGPDALPKALSRQTAPPATGLRQGLYGLALHLRRPGAIPAHAMLHAARRVAHSLPAASATHNGSMPPVAPVAPAPGARPVRMAALIWLLERGKSWLLGHLESAARGDTTIRRGLIELDLGLTAVLGCLRDGVIGGGWAAIDGEDLRAWFARHGASPAAVRSTPIRALYDLYLAYPNGDREHPELAAGVGVHAVLRLSLGYKGSVVNEMRGGMGEIVIAPLYEALARRGVRFAFFHQVERLELSPTGAASPESTSPSRST